MQSQKKRHDKFGRQQGEEQQSKKKKLKKLSVKKPGSNSYAKRMKPRQLKQGKKTIKQCNNEAKQKRKHIKDSTESRENRGRNTQEGKD